MTTDLSRTFIAHGPAGTIRRAIPHGWQKDGETDFSHRPIMRCLSDVCRAYVTDPDRAEQHDREFHLLLVGPHVGIGTVPHHVLSIDGGEVGVLMQVPLDVQAKPVVYQWVVQMPARGPLFDRVDVRCDTKAGALAEAGRIHPLAKWWSEGLHITSWQPVEP
jgi:hypothetical protein